MFFPGHPGKPGRKKRRHWPESQVKSRIICCRIAGTDFPARTVLSGSPYTLAFPLFGEIISAKDKTISGAEAFLLVWGLPDVPAGFTATRCKNRSSPGEPAVRWPIRADRPETCSGLSRPCFPDSPFSAPLPRFPAQKPSRVRTNGSGKRKTRCEKDGRPRRVSDTTTFGTALVRYRTFSGKTQRKKRKRQFRPLSRPPPSRTGRQDDSGQYR